MTTGSAPIPMLAYDDAPAAMRFLCEALGFEEQFRMEMDDGTIGHAELALEGLQVMVATTWEAGGLSTPHRLGAAHTQLLCYVADVDAHYAHAKGCGATVLGEPQDEPHGARSYRLVDPEGHRWIFTQEVAR